MILLRFVNVSLMKTYLSTSRRIELNVYSLVKERIQEDGRFSINQMDIDVNPLLLTPQNDQTHFQSIKSV